MPDEDKIPTIPARSWNQLRLEAMRNRPLSSPNVRLHWTPEGVIPRLRAQKAFAHPWQLSPRWKADSTSPQGGRWASPVRPGFVDGRDVMIREMREDDSGNPIDASVPLTDETPPELVFGAFRDPAESAGLGATLSGDLVSLPSEGYPPFFEALGVKPAHPGGPFNAQDLPDPDRTREIRACDVVLISPRLAARQTLEVLDAFAGDQQTIQLSTTLVSTALRRDPYHRLITRNKWVPQPPPSPADRLLGTYVESETDELLMATVYWVSLPEAGPDATPDATWTCYPQYNVFWNLAHASKAEHTETPFEPIRFDLPLAAGVGQSLVNAILSPINDSFEAAQAFLASSDFQGIHWAPSGIGVDTIEREGELKEPTSLKTGFDTGARRRQREAARDKDRSPPPLNPPFPYLRTAFDPGFFGLL